jgi:ABC-type branched-subunit amino acid transport system permease subunit
MRIVAATGIGLLAIVPWVAGVRLTSYNAALAVVPALLSLGLLVYISGSISLCHAAFAALGATTFAHLTNFGLPWLVALLLAGVAVIPLGLIVAIPAIRLQGIYLALATFGFGILLEKVAYPAAIMFGTIGARQAPRPKFLGIDGTTEKGFYFITLMVVLATAALVVALVRNRIGKLLRAMGDSPTALSTHGLSVNVTRVLVFCLAAAMAGVSGGLMASQAGRVGGTGFTSFQSLLWLAVLLICGRRPILAPFLAAGLLVVVPAYAPDGFVNYQTMLFGATAILATLLPEFNLGRFLQQLEGDRGARSPVRSRNVGAVVPPAAQAVTVGGLS